MTADKLENRIVLVVFWSFGCEASIRTVERAQSLAMDWSDRIAAVAVHSPRFPYEDDERRLAGALARHRIEIPVVHDPEFVTWNRYGPVGWPATAVVDRSGRVVGLAGGTDGFDAATDVVTAELARPSGRRPRHQGDNSGRPGRRRRRGPGLVAGSSPEATSTGWRHEQDQLHAGSTLWFPSGVAVGPSGQIAVADAGNDRILVGALDGDLRTIRPRVQVTDIDRPTAAVFADDDLLYAVERGSRSVLQIDLANGTVDIVADEELRIPTALVIDRDGSLVVADAGHDQLIRIVGTEDAEVLVGPIAGRGVTGRRDGAAERAELAQPVALARTARGIAFCDAASSNIRLLGDDGTVRTVTGNEFFDWGLVDGPADRARLQRPGGLAAAADGSLVVTDTGNNRVRVLADRQIRTLGLAGLDQPTGVAVLDDGHLLVADTGQHRLVVADPEGRTAWPVSVYPAEMTSVWEETSSEDPIGG